MEGLCASDAGLGLVISLLGSVDCNARRLSELGYRALSAPGSEIAVALTAGLTLYVGIQGLRLMLGLAQLRISELTVAVLKIGLVLALATNWPVYQQIAFNTLFHGPEQLAGSMLQALNAGAVPGGPFEALQAAFDDLQSAAAFFVRSGPALVSPLSGGTAFAGAALNLADYLMLFSTLGSILVAKVVLGMLLGLGPVFAGLLLFENTRGMFAGWLRALFAFAFIPLSATLALVVQMVLLAPYLKSLEQMREAGQPDLALANSVFVLLFISSSISLAAIAGTFIIALGIKLPGRRDVAARDGRVETPLAAREPLTALQGAAGGVATMSTLTAALDRRDARSQQYGDLPRRLEFGVARRESTEAEPALLASAYRHAVRPRRASDTRGEYRT